MRLNEGCDFFSAGKMVRAVEQARLWDALASYELKRPNTRAVRGMSCEALGAK